MGKAATYVDDVRGIVDDVYEDDTDNARDEHGRGATEEKFASKGAGIGRGVESQPAEEEGGEADEGVVAEVGGHDASEWRVAEPRGTDAANRDEEGGLGDIAHDHGRDESTNELDATAHEVGAARDVPRDRHPLVELSRVAIRDVGPGARDERATAFGSESSVVAWRHDAEDLDEHARRVDSVRLSACIHLASPHRNLRSLECVVDVAKEERDADTAHEVAVDEGVREADAVHHRADATHLRRKAIKEEHEEGRGIAAKSPEGISFGDDVGGLERRAQLSRGILQVGNVEEVGDTHGAAHYGRRGTPAKIRRHLLQDGAALGSLFGGAKTALSSRWTVA